MALGDGQGKDVSSSARRANSDRAHLRRADATYVSGSSDETLIVWNLDTGHIKRRLEGHADRVWSVACPATLASRVDR